MLRKELEELFIPEEIDILVKKVSQPADHKTLPNQEEVDTWCKFVNLHFGRFDAKNYERELKCVPPIPSPKATVFIRALLPEVCMFVFARRPSRYKFF